MLNVDSCAFPSSAVHTTLVSVYHVSMAMEKQIQMGIATKSEKKTKKKRQLPHPQFTTTN